MFTGKSLSPAVGTIVVLVAAAVIPALAKREGGAANTSQVGFVTDIVSAANENDKMQLVVMTLQPGQDIGLETHGDVDQFVRVEAGPALLTIGEERHRLEPGSVAILPAGSPHNVANAGSEPLHIYTIYAPPEHPPGTVHAMKPAD